MNKYISLREAVYKYSLPFEFTFSFSEIKYKVLTYDGGDVVRIIEIGNPIEPFAFNIRGYLVKVLINQCPWPDFL